MTAGLEPDDLSGSFQIRPVHGSVLHAPKPVGRNEALFPQPQELHSLKCFTFLVASMRFPNACAVWVLLLNLSEHLGVGILGQGGPSSSPQLSWLEPGANNFKVVSTGYSLKSWTHWCLWVSSNSEYSKILRSLLASFWMQFKLGPFRDISFMLEERVSNWCLHLFRAVLSHCSWQGLRNDLDLSAGKWAAFAFDLSLFSLRSYSCGNERAGL